MRILITGIAGFYGSHLARYISENTDWEIVGLDKIDCAGNLNRLSNTPKFFWHDLRSPINPLLVRQLGKFDYIFHIAAASHVDRSIQDPLSFVYDNVVGTCNILNFARDTKPAKFFYFSTDEVFGPNTNGKFKEWDRYNSGNPYSATKAGGEELALAFHNTYGVPVIITHCMNIFGEYQHPEKFIPKVISLLRKDETIPIYANSTKTVSGSRSYIYADDVSRALMLLVDKGEIGQKYNIEGSREIENLEVAKLIADRMGRDLKVEMIASDSVRPGNDFSYGIDGSKLRDMGFESKHDFHTQLYKVIDWYLDNPIWLLS